MALLEVKDLSKNFGGLAVLSHLEMEVQPGQIHALIGPNGAGKSTLFNVITGVFKPSSGKVLFDGEDITGLMTSTIARKRLVRTFQLTTLFAEETAEYNVSLGFHLQAKVGLWETLVNAPSYRRKERNVQNKIEELMSFVRISHLKGMTAKNLPHGHQRSLGVAIALAAEPKMLLMDEPVTGMNLEETQEMMSLIRRIRDEKGITVLLVEHDMKVVMEVCERIVVLNYGQKIAEGTPKEISSDPSVIKAYLGAESDAT